MSNILISHQLKIPLAYFIMFNELMLENKNMENSQREDFLLISLSLTRWDSLFYIY